MNRSSNRQTRQKIFTWVVLGCLALAVGYTAWVIIRASSNAQARAEGTLLPTAGLNDQKSLQSGPHLVFLNEAEPHLGEVKLAGLDPSFSPGVQTALPCGRVHYAADSGICLMADPSAPDTRIQVTLFGPDF